MFEKIWEWIEKIPLYKRLNEHRLFGKIINREVLLYLLFGALTTVVSTVMFYLPDKLFGLIGYRGVVYYITHIETEKGFAYMEANVISWICAVTFAYVTNKRFVFESEGTDKKTVLREMATFYGGRLATLGVDMLLMFLLVTLLSMHSLLAKIIVQVVIVVLNYFISKWVVFRKPKEKLPEETESSE